MVAQIVTVADAKTFLNITASGTDAELSDFVDAASQMIVNRIGPVADATACDEWYDGGTPQIVLRHSPVQAIVAVTEAYAPQTVYTLTAQVLDAGAALGPYGYTIDLGIGLLTRRVNGIAAPFAPGLMNIHVTYTAGYATAPADIKQATKLLLQHMWITQRGGSKRPGRGGDETIQPGTAFAWPARVEEILSAYYVPGIA